MYTLTCNEVLSVSGGVSADQAVSAIEDTGGALLGAAGAAAETGNEIGAGLLAAAGAGLLAGAAIDHLLGL